MPKFMRTVHHDLPLERAREVVTATATRLGFSPDATGQLAFRRGTWATHLTALTPKRVRAWLVVALREGEASLELDASGFLIVIYPQDRRFYEAELEALEAALHGRDPGTDAVEAERQAHLFSWIAAALVFALAAGAIAHCSGLRWF